MLYVLFCLILFRLSLRLWICTKKALTIASYLLRWPEGLLVDLATVVLMLMVCRFIICVCQAFTQAPRLLQPSILQDLSLWWMSCRLLGGESLSLILYIHDCIQSRTQTLQVAACVSCGSAFILSRLHARLRCSASQRWSFIRIRLNSLCGGFLMFAA